TKVSNNDINFIGGSADIGIYVGADQTTLLNNRVYDWGVDLGGVDNDYGIINDGNLNGGLDNSFTKNKVRCFLTAYDNVSGASHIILPCTDPTSSGPTFAPVYGHGMASPIR